MKIGYMTILAAVCTVSIYAADGSAKAKGEMIFDEKCLMCHKKSRPANKNSAIAPALPGMMKHVKEAYPDKRSAVAFIIDFVLNPSMEKAICDPEKISRFGLMPSQKGNIDKRDLETVSEWMFDNFPPAGFKGYGKTRNR